MNERKRLRAESFAHWMSSPQFRRGPAASQSVVDFCRELAILILPHNQGAWRSANKGDLTPFSRPGLFGRADCHDVIKIYPYLVAVCRGAFHPSWHRALQFVRLSRAM